MNNLFGISMFLCMFVIVLSNKTPNWDKKNLMNIYNLA